MKKSGLVLGSIVFVTLIFYLLAYYLLPPPPPSAALMVLFAAIASVLVWSFQWGLRKRRSKKSGHMVLLPVIGLLGLVYCYPAHATVQQFRVICQFTSGPRAGTTQVFVASSVVEVGHPCQDGAGSAGQITAVQAIRDDSNSSDNDSAPAASAPAGGGAPPAATPSAPAYAPPPPPPAYAQPATPAHAAEADSAASDQAAMGPSLPRVTGIASLLPHQQAEPGFGLYSYALLSHAPQESELPRYRAFLTALVELPTAKDLGVYLRKRRINITYIPLLSTPRDWNALAVGGRVDYVLAHYDYARGAAMLASLPGSMGPGPVITSVLEPLSFDHSPHPVLVQDLSRAQPVLMADYVKKFVDQAAQDHFWEAKTLEAFSLGLRNILETSAIGLGMSQEAVQKWVNYFK